MPRASAALDYAVVDSPIGQLLLAGRGDTLEVLWFLHGRRPATLDPSWRLAPGAFDGVARQLSEYFAGARTRFEIDVAPQGTEFQRRVWRALCEIPYGQTISYGELARRLGDVKAVRAVGLANGANPVAIVIPCHRVIGANGSLVGFGGGLPIKRALLDLEQGHQRLL